MSENILTAEGIWEGLSNYWIKSFYRESSLIQPHEILTRKEALAEFRKTIESVRGKLDPAYTNHYHRGFDIAIDAVLETLGLSDLTDQETPVRSPESGSI